MAEKFRTEPMLVHTAETMIALREDGTVWAAGRNSSGALGDPSLEPNTYRYEPRQVIGPEGIGFLHNVKYIAGESGVFAAITEDGALWMWGSNGKSYLGIGTVDSDSHPIPQRVLGENGIGYLENVVKVFREPGRTIAILDNGDAYMWGVDTLTAETISTPRKLPLTNVIEVGGHNKLANCLNLLTAEGQVYSIGQQAYLTGTGQSGRQEVSTFTPIVKNNGEVLNNIVSLQSNCVLCSDGTVWAWSRTDLSGTSNASIVTILESAVQVCGENNEGYLVNIDRLYASFYVAVAFNKKGEAFVWRSNKYGQLGIPPEELLQAYYPIRCPQLDDAILVSSGNAQDGLLFAKADGTVWCCGRYAFDFGNNGKTGDTHIPQPVLWESGGEMFNLFVDERTDPGTDPSPGEDCNKCCDCCCRPIFNFYNCTGPITIHNEGCSGCTFQYDEDKTEE